jgi:hypothetical protein
VAFDRRSAYPADQEKSLKVGTCEKKDARTGVFEQDQRVILDRAQASKGLQA